MREAALLGRAFGMTRAQPTDAIIWGIVYAGPAAIAVASRAAADVLRSVD